MSKRSPDSPRRKIFNRRRIQFAYSVLRWHGRLGIIASLFVLILLITGIALNHTERLSLDEKYVAAEWLLNWYGIAPKNRPVSYRAGSRWITDLDGHIFLDQTFIHESTRPIVGAHTTQEMVVVATEDTFYLFGHDGSLIEKMNTLPGKILRLGARDDHTYIDTPLGIFSTDSNFVAWQQAETIPNWISSSSLPKPIRQTILDGYRGRGLPLERVVLDLHSGRILGAWGPYLMDAAAIILLILVLSGFYNWTIRR